MQNALNDLWRYTDELFFENEVDEDLRGKGVIFSSEELKASWSEVVEKVLEQATLSIPDNGWQHDGGRRGLHSEHLGYILAELQYMQRAYPGMEW